MSEWKELGTISYLRRSDGWWRVVIVELPNGTNDVLFRKSNWLSVTLAKVFRRTSLLSVSPPQA